MDILQRRWFSKRSHRILTPISPQSETQKGFTIPPDYSNIVKLEEPYNTGTNSHSGIDRYCSVLSSLDDIDFNSYRPYLQFTIVINSGNLWSSKLTSGEQNIIFSDYPLAIFQSIFIVACISVSIMIM